MPCAAPCNALPSSSRCPKTLACGHQCPGVLGELCPSKDYCQQCGKEENLGQTADYISGEDYRDIDLDENPCIFMTCGHICSIESLDGWMGMSNHYDTDPITGKFVRIKSSSEPFSSDELKLCPACRGPLRDIARYGRIVRRAMLDESAKKFVVWSNQRHLLLSERVVEEQERLLNDIDTVRKPNQDVRIVGTAENQVQSLKKLKTAARYRHILQLYQEIKAFVDKLRKDEQPYQRVKDLVEIALRQNERPGIERFDFAASELQLREHLQGLSLLIRCEMVFISDGISMHNKTPTSDRKGTLVVDLHDSRTRCETLADDAKATMNFRQEIEGNLFWARFAAMECGTIDVQAERERPNATRVRETLNRQALARLRNANSVCDKLPGSTADLLNEIKDVKRMLDAGTSESEMRMIVATMAKEFRGTGHWYRCRNGHPFAIGECGE